MASKVQKLYEKAMQLSEDEREVLSLMLTNAARCNDANNGWASSEIEQAWMEEIERREKLDAEGKMKWIPGEEVMRDLRKLVSE
jgi:hypothetical protein